MLWREGLWAKPHDDLGQHARYLFVAFEARVQLAHLLGEISDLLGMCLRLINYPLHLLFYT